MAPNVLTEGQGSRGYAFRSTARIGTGPHVGRCRRIDKIRFTSRIGVDIGLE
jgi:hypothetical protein